MASPPKRQREDSETNRPYVIVHTIASVDGRVSLGPDRTGFDDVGDERWQGIWASDVGLDDSVHHLYAAFAPQAFLEGSGSFVTENASLDPLPPSDISRATLHEDYLPDSVVNRSDHIGWFSAVDGQGRLRSGMKEFPGWEGWRTLHLVSHSAPDDYLAFLRRNEIPYLIGGEKQVDLQLVMMKLKQCLKVQRLVCTAGSRLNGALLRAGLVDELSLVLLPALIGGTRTPHLFVSPDLNGEQWATKLELLSVQQETKGRVNLRYIRYSVVTWAVVRFSIRCYLLKFVPLTSKGMESTIEFLRILSQLKNIERRGWVENKVRFPESISDHMYRMSMLCMLCPDATLDKNRMIRMALCHDVGEALIGDITPSMKVPKEEKARRERDAITSISGLVPPVGNEIKELWEEFEAQETPESHFVRDMDLLEMIIQANEYENAQPPLVLEGFFASGEGIRHPWARTILDTIVRSRAARCATPNAQ